MKNSTRLVENVHIPPGWWNIYIFHQAGGKSRGFSKFDSFCTNSPSLICWNQKIESVCNYGYLSQWSSVTELRRPLFPKEMHLKEEYDITYQLDDHNSWQLFEQCVVEITSCPFFNYPMEPFNRRNMFLSGGNVEKNFILSESGCQSLEQSI